MKAGRKKRELVHISSLSVSEDIMESVVGNITQHAGMGDDRPSGRTRCELF